MNNIKKLQKEVLDNNMYKEYYDLGFLAGKIEGLAIARKLYFKTFDKIMGGKHGRRTDKKETSRTL